MQYGKLQKVHAISDAPSGVGLGQFEEGYFLDPVVGMPFQIAVDDSRDLRRLVTSPVKEIYTVPVDSVYEVAPGHQARLKKGDQVITTKNSLYVLKRRGKNDGA